MNNPIPPILLLTFTAISAACSSDGFRNDGSGGHAEGTTGQGGAAGGADSSETSAAGGSAGPGGRVGSGGSRATGGTATTAGQTGFAGAGGGARQTASGGTKATGSGGTKATGSGGTKATGGHSGGDATGGSIRQDAGLGGGAGGGGTGGKAGGSALGDAGSGGTAGMGDTDSASPSDGCGKSPTLTSGSHKIQSSGASRSYMIRIPNNYDKSRPYRLIFAFHWNGGTMGDVDGGGTSGYTWSYYGLRERADDSTIFVAPQGNGNGWANPGGKDLTFVDDMLKLFEGELCIDKNRIFSMGFSYGGGMSYELACARAKVFRAVAVYSGGQLSGCDGGKDPIAYMGLHGIGDPTCNIGGGRSLRDTFVKNNGCTAQNPPEPAKGSLAHKVTSYSGCKPGYPVVWAAFDGGHTPAPVDGASADSGGGDKTWTKAEVWKFFTETIYN